MDKINCKEHGERSAIRFAGCDYMCSQCYHEGMSEMVKKNNRVYDQDGNPIKGLRLAPSHKVDKDGNIEWGPVSFINVSEEDDEH